MIGYCISFFFLATKRPSYAHVKNCKKRTREQGVRTKGLAHIQLPHIVRTYIGGRCSCFLSPRSRCQISDLPSEDPKISTPESRTAHGTRRPFSIDAHEGWMRSWNGDICMYVGRRRSVFATLCVLSGTSRMCRRGGGFAFPHTTEKHQKHPPPVQHVGVRTCV